MTKADYLLLAHCYLWELAMFRLPAALSILVQWLYFNGILLVSGHPERNEGWLYKCFFYLKKWLFVSLYHKVLKSIFKSYHKNCPSGDENASPCIIFCCKLFWDYLKCFMIGRRCSVAFVNYRNKSLTSGSLTGMACPIFSDCDPDQKISSVQSAPILQASHARPPAFYCNTIRRSC